MARHVERVEGAIGPTYLFVDPLSAVLTLDHVLDDRVTAEVLVQASQSIEGHTEAEEVDGLVEKHAILGFWTELARIRTRKQNFFLFF